MVTQTSNEKIFVCISRGKKLWRLYDKASVKIKRNPCMASQKKEHFTSVFSNVIVQLGGIGVNFLLEMRPLKIIES